MVEFKNAASTAPRATASPRVDTPTSEETVWVKLIAHSAEGVLFHMSERDLFDVLGLKGFFKMHCHQVKDESEELEEFKEKYIKTYGKIPYFDIPGGNKWADKVNVYRNMDQELVVEAVRKSMHDYLEWERSTLDILLQSKTTSKDRKAIYKMISGVMEELKFIEDIDDCLEDHGYTYDAVCEMSEYLCNKY